MRRTMVADEPPRSSRWMRLWVVVCAALALATASGCWKSSKAPPGNQKAIAKLKEKKPERPFEDLRIFTEPNERSQYEPDDKSNQRIVLATKPNHWSSLRLQTQANLFDFDGRLQTRAQGSTQQPVDLEFAPYWVSTTRVVTLPKEQRKVFETLFFPPKPKPDSINRTASWIGNRIDGAKGPPISTSEMAPHMPSFQYYWIVLAAQPDRYRYLNDLASVRPPAQFMPPNLIDTCYYRVLFPDVREPLALPRLALCWTSTAHLLWDNVLPGALAPEQQQALLDWLHWGGGLVVSGPDSLDKLRGSFLEPYLPATGGAAGPLDEKKLAEFHHAWSVPDDTSDPLGGDEDKPWSGIELVPQAGADFVPGTAGMVAERRVGRGRIAVTAFRLTEPELTRWPSFDSFVNGCLLARPPRRFDDEQEEFAFVGPGAPKRHDAAAATHVRYYSRDAEKPKDEEELARELDQLDASLDSDQPWIDPYVQQTELIERLKGEPGLAAWNDFSWISSTARDTLQSAAGISVPRRQFVLKMVGVYLLVIVPLNWLVFRLVGRVEWAWFAVPVVAAVWGLLVVWLAQLDIGFARAQTEVDVLEVQADYPRGHLTRYTALYTSLSSDYDVRFADASAVALPFASGAHLSFGRSPEEVRLTTTGKRDLEGYPVASNSTGMIHSEQMFDLGGAIRWDDSNAGTFVENGTQMKLSGAAVIRRHKGGAEVAWLGDLEPGGRAEVRFGAEQRALLETKRQQNAVSAKLEDAAGGLSLQKLIACAEDSRSLAPGDVRLVAWHDAALPGVEVTPATAQTRGATLIVAQLAYGPGGPCRPDENLHVQRNSFDAALGTP